MRNCIETFYIEVKIWAAATVPTLTLAQKLTLLTDRPTLVFHVVEVRNNERHAGGSRSRGGSSTGTYATSSGGASGGGTAHHGDQAPRAASTVLQRMGTTLFHSLFPQIAPKILRCSTIFQKKVYSRCRQIATFMGSSECPPHMASDDAKDIKNKLR